MENQTGIAWSLYVWLSYTWCSLYYLIIDHDIDLTDSISFFEPFFDFFCARSKQWDDPKHKECSKEDWIEHTKDSLITTFQDSSENFIFPNTSQSKYSKMRSKGKSNIPYQEKGAEETVIDF